MARTIAVLSDIHGVLPNLDAVLAEPDVRNADLIAITGDLAAGPQPVEVLDRLIAWHDRIVCVRGNTDRDLLALARGADTPPGLPAVDLWAAKQITDVHRAFLDALPHPLVVSLDGVGSVLLCHGTPRSVDEIVLVDTRLSRWNQVLSDVDESVAIVYAHAICAAD